MGFEMLTLLSFPTEYSCMAFLTLTMMGNEGVYFHPLICSVLISVIFSLFLCEGLFRKFIMVVCEFYELEFVGSRGGCECFGFGVGSCNT